MKRNRKIRYSAIKQMVERNGGIVNLALKSNKENQVLLRYVYFMLCFEDEEIHFSQTDSAKLLGYSHGSAMHGVRKFNQNKSQSFFNNYLEVYRVCSSEIKNSKQISKFELFSEMKMMQDRIAVLLDIFLHEIDIEFEEIKTPYPPSIKRNKKGQFTA